MKRLIYVGTTVAVMTAAAVASAAMMDPIATRQMVMKNNGAAIGALAKMAKGEEDFNATAANLAVRMLWDSQVGFTALFPAGTETGNDTTASPKIWEDMAGFEAKSQELQEVAASIVATPITDLDGVKAALGQLGKTCQGCHETYRVKKDG
jgi:cytochrome c556